MTVASAPLPHQVTDGYHISTRIFAVDPGQKRGKTAIICPDGTCVHPNSFVEFLDGLQPGDTVITEATAHVYRDKDRQILFDKAEEKGVTLLAMRPVHTPKHRKKLGLSKGDMGDAVTIKHVFGLNPSLFYRLKRNPCRLGSTTEPGTPRYEVNEQLVALRLVGYPGYPKKNAVHEATIDVLAKVAVAFGLSNREFDRLTGFNGCGYPSIARSNRNKHGAGKDPLTRGERMKVYRQKARRRFKDLRSQALLPQLAMSKAGLLTSATADVQPQASTPRPSLVGPYAPAEIEP